MLLVLALLSAIGSVGLFSYTQSSGGWDATVVVNEHVFTGPALYGISVLLMLAGGLFLVGAILKAIRRVVALVAAAFIAGGGAIGGLSPKGLADYEAKHACAVIGHTCTSVPKLSVPGGSKGG